MQVLSIMPLSTAGINNRQMRPNTMSTPAFQGNVKFLEGTRATRQNLQHTHVGQQTTNAIVDLVLGNGENGFKTAAKKNGIDIAVSSKIEGDKTVFRLAVKTDDKTYHRDGKLGLGYVRDTRSHHDPITISSKTTPERAREKLNAGLHKLVTSHNKGRAEKTVG